jgi:hypothetical protein
MSISTKYFVPLRQFDLDVTFSQDPLHTVLRKCPQVTVTSLTFVCSNSNYIHIYGLVYYIKSESYWGTSYYLRNTKIVSVTHTTTTGIADLSHLPVQCCTLAYRSIQIMYCTYIVRSTQHTFRTRFFRNSMIHYCMPQSLHTRTEYRTGTSYGVRGTE